MTLAGYLHRIGFTGDARRDLPTLRRIHRLHLAAIPYENFDVQLGRALGFDMQTTYRKIVVEQRGGWCYEMNGLFAWALEQIGFRVTRLAGAVMRDQNGDEWIGSHLVLCVHLDEPYLADVGFGDGLIEPMLLAEGAVRQDDFDFRLERLDERWWRFHNHAFGGAPSFDFELAEAPRERLTERCEWLQSAPKSPFVLNAVCERYVDGRLFTLRGRMLKIFSGQTVDKRTIESQDDFTSVLRDMFGLELPEAPVLWPKIVARHEVWLREQANA